MTTFALAHGAFHGAWCWELLTPLLEEAGHDVVAMELPIDDPSASFDDQADVVCSAIQGHDDAVLVGHSFAGNVIPLVAARRPLRHLVYLCAAVPEPGRSMNDQLTDDECMLNARVFAGLGATDVDTCVSWVDLELARELFYADCAEATADAAVGRLRVQSGYSALLPFSLSEFPSVPTTSVVCSAISSWYPSGRGGPLASDSTPTWSSFPGVTPRSTRGRQCSPTCCSASPPADTVAATAPRRLATPPNIELALREQATRNCWPPAPARRSRRSGRPTAPGTSARGSG